MDLTLTQNMVQSQRLEQMLVPQQIQALEILQATVQELELKIGQELVENPTLELLDNGVEDLVGDPLGGNGDVAGAGGDEAARAVEMDETLATLIQINESWRDYASLARGTVGNHTPEDQEKRQFMLDSLVQEPTLQDLLLAQLRETDGLDAEELRVCEQVIGSIDDKGYLATHPSDIATASAVDLPVVQRAVRLVQSFDPPGVGARDLRECLLLQLERQGRQGAIEYRVVDQHLDDIARNQIPKVARALGVSSNRLYEILESIRELTPHPGSLVTPPSEGDYVYAEVYIEKDEQGAWRVRSNREFAPRLRISPYYLQLLQDPATPREAKSYIRAKVANSKLLMRAIDQRQSTIERIATSLLRFQIDFFENGVSHMRPLVMSQVAEDIGVHETTVSRAIANKYVQTPHGLFPFKHFFTTGYRADDGAMLSSLGIKQLIQELIGSEDAKRPLSDQRLAALLGEKGFDVARRTVAKYREEMGIQPSHLRRNF